MDNIITGRQCDVTAIFPLINSITTRLARLESANKSTVTSFNSSSSTSSFTVQSPLSYINGVISLPNVSWSLITNRPNTLAGYGISDQVISPTGSYVNPSWLVSLSVNKISGLAKVATSNDYNDLINKPDLSNIGTSVQANWTQNNTTSSDYIKNKPVFASVALTGNYVDLTNKPTIPPAQVNSDWNAISGLASILNKPTFSSVALSGSYVDLNNKPVFATVAITGSYNDLVDKPTIAGQVQADWTIIDVNNSGYIKNKPTLATVARTGNYTDLVGKPTLATVATSGNYTDLIGKPTLATVASTGNYNDLSNRPTVPAQFSPIASTGITISGTYPNLIFTATNTGTVTSVTGTTNRISVTSAATTPVINISTSYIGQASITTLGTITTGTWNGTPIANNFLANSIITINGTPVSLGGSINVTGTTGSGNLQQTLTAGSILTTNNTITIGTNDLKVGATTDYSAIQFLKADSSLNLITNKTKIGKTTTASRTKIGALIQPETAFTNVAPSLNIHYGRVTTKFFGIPTASTRYRNLSDAGFEANVGIGYFANDDTHNFPTGSELTDYISRLTAYLNGMSGYNVGFISIENEENNDSYRIIDANSAGYYLTQLQQSITIAHARGIKVTNGGLTGHTMKYVAYKWLVSHGRTADAQIILDSDLNLHQSQINAGTYESTFANQLAIVNGVLNNGASMGLDWVNFHWYCGSGTTQSLTPMTAPILLTKEAFEAISGLPAIMNELGQHNSVASHPPDILKDLTEAGFEYLIWYSGDDGVEGGAVALQNSDNSLRPNGVNFANFVNSYQNVAQPIVVSNYDIQLNEKYEGLLYLDGNNKVTSISPNTYLKPENYVPREQPTGTVNGTNRVFTLRTMPVTDTEMVFKNGILQLPTTHYSISYSAITFNTAPSSGDLIRVTYFKLI